MDAISMNEAGKLNARMRSVDGYLPVFHRLAHDFKYGSLKLRQLIQEEHTIMCK
jgi:hypothetical protein